MTIGPSIGRMIAATAEACGRRPYATLILAFVLATIALVYAVRTITFVSAHLRLLPQNERYVIRLKEYQDDFGELNDIVVVVESPSPDLSKEYAGRLTRELRQAGLTTPRITYRVDPSYFDHRALLYLPVKDLEKLRDRLFDYQKFIEGYAAQPSLPRLFEGLNQQIANSMVLGFFDLGLGGERSTDLRFLESVVDQINGRLDGDSGYASPWSAAFSVGRLDDPDAGYFFSSDRHWLFVLVQEGEFVERRDAILGIRRAIARLQRDFPSVQAGVTGGPAIASDEMYTAFDDSKVATILAFTLTLGLMVTATRRFVAPLLILMTLSVSLAWSLGIIALVVGHLSIFSVMFISIVVGVGTDYGIYYLFRYDEERRFGTLAGAVRTAGERAGPGMLLGALTAAGAFVVLMLTDFQGIREFGFVSAMAIMMAFLSMITVLPALLTLLGRYRPSAAPAPASATVDEATWLVRVTRYRKVILVGAVALSAFAVWGAIQIDFNYNMLKLQAKGVESVVWEQKILAKAGRSGFAALATAKSLDELKRKQDAFAALPSVSKVESLLMLVPDDQLEKVRLVKQLAPLVEPIKIGTARDLEPSDLKAPLETLRRRLKLATSEGGEKAQKEVAPVLAKLEGVLDKLGRAESQSAGPRLQRLQEQIARDFGDKLKNFQKSLDPQPVQAGDAPPELRNRYIGKSGRYLLRVHPAVDIWQQAGAERFVTDLRSVDPDVTGPPITSFEAIRYIRRGYFQGTLYALILVVVVTAAILRSVRGTALALSPLGLGVLWTLGFMHVFGLEFTLANVWALPLIIGTAAEFGLNIFVRYQEGRETGRPTLARSTVMAVALNGLTTMAGFSSLMVAHHRGIFGLGFLLTVGMVASLVGSLAVLPVLLRLFYGPATSDASPVSGGDSGDTRKSAAGFERATSELSAR
jgi:hopanoid biosynthesis associated RND transporter like protein HpnN